MYLGIDIGTSGIKASVTDPEGKVRSAVLKPLTMYGLEEGHKELDGNEIRETVFAAVSEVLSGVSPGEISLITVSSLGEALVPIDREGNVLSRTIVGSDARGSGELSQFAKEFGEKKLVEITGLNLNPIYSLNKILYIKKHQPRIHERVWKYLLVADYAVYCLTGETLTDYAMASRTMAFELRSMSWSEEILSAAELSPSLLPAPVPGNRIAGTLTREAASRTGLRPGTEVLTGSHDHIYNAIGAGAVLSGTASNVVGTTEGITAVFDRAMSAESIIKSHISCQPFVLPGIFNTVAWHNTAGAMVKWYLSEISDGKESGEETLKRLTETLRSTPSSLMVLPHFSGSVIQGDDMDAKGAILGLTLSTRREDLFKALLEGSSLECRIILGHIEEAGIDVKRIICSGGGSRSPLWMQIKANVLHRPVFRSRLADTGTLGGAVLGAVVKKEFDSLSEAAKVMLPPPEEFEPEEEAAKVFDGRFEEYWTLYGKLRDVNRLL